MKKTTTLCLLCATILGLTTTSCSDDNGKKTKKQTETTCTDTSCNAPKIAYIEIDTLMAQYKFCQDYTILMNRKGENIRATLASKERALQANAAEMQKKYESNQFTTKEQVEQAQMTLAKQQQDLQDLSDRLTNDFALEQAKYNNEMRDSIQSFLKDYNKQQQYDYILSKAGDNILLANPIYDITNDVVQGLNKRYKPSPEIQSMAD